MKLKYIGSVRHILFYTCLLLVISINSYAQETRWIDDIVADTLLDDTFKVCNSDEQIIQYFNNGKGVQYVGGKKAIDSLFFAAFQNVDAQLSGMIRIRFVVNCKGHTGRFRLLTADLNYQPVFFPEKITAHLLAIAKSMRGWEPKVWKEMQIDYYQNIILRFEHGQLKNVIV